MSNPLVAEKLQQATRLVAESPFDVWITFVRETAEAADPLLPFLIEGSVTWQSAFLIGKNGRRVAIVGKYDHEPLVKSGNWDEVVPYVQDIKPVLRDAIAAMAPGTTPRIAVNFSVNDEKCDGLSHGMFLLLNSYLAGTPFAELESAEELCAALRGRKTADEIRRIKNALAAGDLLFDDIVRFASVGVSEAAVFETVHRLATEGGLGFSWDPCQDPIVNSGPDSMVGHGTPSSTITIQPGHIFHVDLGVLVDGYASDIQRSWYVRSSPREEIPEDVAKAFEAVRGALVKGFETLRPGVHGWQVDAAAREFLVAAGYEEYQHALGHQVGRMAHDGGALLGPKWARYGDRPSIPVSEGEVYTLELGVVLPKRGYLGLEEMVRVTDSACEWLSQPQTEIMFL